MSFHLAYSCNDIEMFFLGYIYMLIYLIGMNFTRRTYISVSICFHRLPLSAMDWIAVLPCYQISLTMKAQVLTVTNTTHDEGV